MLILCILLVTMIYRLRYLFTLLAILFLQGQTSANSAFTAGTWTNNVSVQSGIINVDYDQIRILAFSLQELYNKLHSKTNIVIEHNTDLVYNGMREITQKDYRWAVKYDPKYVLKNSSHSPVSSIVIYYSGYLSIEEYKGIVYYCLTHLDEIKSKQKTIQLPFSGEDNKEIAVADSILNIALLYTDSANTILGNKPIYVGYLFQAPQITYYYLNGIFNFIYPDKPINEDNRYDNRDIPGKEIISIDSFYKIATFPNDYFIFESEHTFYRFDLLTKKISGPYTEPGYKRFFESGLYHMNYREENNLLITTIYYELYRDSVEIVFDKATKTVNSNHIPVLLARGWPLSIRPYFNGQRRTIPEIKPVENNPTGAYMLLGILSLNSIAILLSAKRKI